MITQASPKKQLPHLQFSGFSTPLLTLRGLALCITCVLLLLGPVRLHNDIVATVAASSVLVLLFLAVLGVVFNTLRLRSTLELTSGDHSPIVTYSNVPFRTILRLSPAPLSPFFSIRCKLQFAQGEVAVPLVQISGWSNAPRSIPLDLTFPHRGMWELLVAQFEICDQLGLLRFVWTPKYAQIAEFRVEPSASPQLTLPVISSSYREGDEQPALHAQLGDPYEVKQYQPSDGLKRVIWKLYAKSGELFARHPEHSMTPEGSVAIFILAGSPDDDLCRQALGYTHQLEQLGLSLLIGCSGTSSRTVARSTSAACDLLVETVWQSDASAEDAFADFITAAQHEIAPAQLSSVCIFVAPRRAEAPFADSELAAISTICSSHAVRPVLFLGLDSHITSSSHSIISRWFVDEKNDTTITQTSDPKKLSHYLALPIAQGWETIQLERM